MTLRERGVRDPPETLREGSVTPMTLKGGSVTPVTLKEGVCDP